MGRKPIKAYKHTLLKKGEGCALINWNFKFIDDPVNRWRDSFKNLQWLPGLSVQNLKCIT